MLGWGGLDFGAKRLMTHLLLLQVRGSLAIDSNFPDDYLPECAMYERSEVNIISIKVFRGCTLSD